VGRRCRRRFLPLYAAQVASSVKFPDKICDITHYGAEGHRLQIALNTDAIQKAIDDCAAEGERCWCQKVIS
jgi:polygalacturonase